MQTVLYVSPMTTGDEVEVRRIHERFPLEALDAGVGVERLIAFIGSGIYALEITVGDGDFQEQFHRFLRTPAVQDLFRELSPHVKTLPGPDQETADMPLAAPTLIWQGTADRAASST
ncbi:MAG: hypothetical protein QOG89_2582 [Thermomicrobiales bacterium]|nr:hypothetical protein [Thermomicrobiales bacterium]